MAGVDGFDVVERGGFGDFEAGLAELVGGLVEGVADGFAGLVEVGALLFQ